MKKVILSAIALLAITFSNAQDNGAKSFGFSKGDVLVEGNLSFDSTNDKNSDTKTYDTSFTPQAGYFVSDKFALGVTLGVNFDRTKTSGVTTSKTSTVAAGVFGRYYFLDLGQRFKTYTEVGVAFAHGRNSVTDVEANIIGAGAGIGINYFVTERIVLNLGLRNILSYANSNQTGPAKSTSALSFGLNDDITNPFAAATFGVGYKF